MIHRTFHNKLWNIRCWTQYTPELTRIYAYDSYDMNNGLTELVRALSLIYKLKYITPDQISVHGIDWVHWTPCHMDNLPMIFQNLNYCRKEIKFITGPSVNQSGRPTTNIEIFDDFSTLWRLPKNKSRFCEIFLQ